MRFLILSDTHANWHALEAVLTDAEGRFDQIVCCGDLVGYNAEPVRVLEWTRAHSAHTIRGNHDKVVAGIENLEWFNEVAQSAARWTIHQLGAPQINYLKQLPKGPLQLDCFHMWHGSPEDEDEYVTNTREAARCFPHFTLPVAFFGHTHLQGGFFKKQSRIGIIPAVRKGQTESVIELEPDTLYLVNPGSVGQPRDGDPRAAYAVYDSEQRAVILRRVEYAVQKTAQEIRQAHLPDVLAFRLAQGL
ncbi:MAG TPA: metallophosphoesterase family protein [Bryobacteraceae bacterium]|nr:metallophosphoesterase family protein [Bryobacteraceae bacterium]